MLKFVFKHAGLSEVSELTSIYEMAFLIETIENFETLLFVLSMKFAKAVCL